MTVSMRSLEEILAETPYAGYTYSYPHKTAYRRFPEPLPLAELWASEKRDDLALYMHIPFCEMRCGFCNLFTIVNPGQSLETGYLAALRREAESAREALNTCRVTRLALGGGTPTYLSVEELTQLFAIAEGLFGVRPGSVPLSVETSPMTAQQEKLELLKAHGADRISIGVQSFVEAETRAAGRPQRASSVERALETIRRVAFPTLNIDLIYGLPGQTVASWLQSLETALRYQPEELYLYPLYVRPLTGLGRRGNARKEGDSLRLACYHAGRELLLARGYTQISMRMFRAFRVHEETGPVYCAQEDGMLGLGCGARSYTTAYQYASEYAVGASGVRAILQHYLARSTESFAYAHYGFHLDGEEQRRRQLITSLFDTGGIDPVHYQQRFKSEILSDFPAFQQLLDLRLVESKCGLLQLTAKGLAYSDAIGPWLYSQRVQTLMKDYQLQ
ncbi:MAG TPA: STM4012 family radical SAM protein [Ktedonobacteraceae bacterium]|nr:STM4012 family radical SAM protein [Ktedonobacteraceae bacterium]